MASDAAAGGSVFKADFNFGTTTAAETGLCGASRPGAKQQRCYAEDLRVTAEEVEEWVAFMKAAGVQAVVSMLSDSELATYAQPLVPSLTAAFGAENYVNIDAKGDQGAPAKIMRALKAARAADKTVLVHCWGGGGRTGLVQAAWLVSSGMSPEAAAEAVTAWGSDHGLSRRVDVAALKEFLAAAGEQ